MDIRNEYLWIRQDLYFHAGKGIDHRPHVWTDINNNDWDFSDAIGFRFRIWEEREGGLLMIDWDSNNLTPFGTKGFYLTAPPTDTDIERGKYYYEIEYLVAGGYSVPIGVGDAYFI